MMHIDLKAVRPNITCAICSNIFDQPTTIKACMCIHTFCWKCIYGKITEHDWKCCPVCYADLGSEPLEELRHDHRYEKLIKALFPPEQEDVETECENSGDSSSSSIDMKK